MLMQWPLEAYHQRICSFDPMSHVLCEDLSQERPKGGFLNSESKARNILDHPLKTDLAKRVVSAASLPSNPEKQKL